MTLIFLDRFGSLLTSWSSRDSLNMKKDGHNLEDDDDLMNQKGKIVLLDIFFQVQECNYKHNRCNQYRYTKEKIFLCGFRVLSSDMAPQVVQNGV